VALQLVALVWLAGLAEHELYDSIEFFSGMGAITSAFVTGGFAGVSYELEDDPVVEDITSRCGLVYAVALLLQARPGCSVWFLG